MLRHVVGAKQPQPWPYQQPTWVFTTRTLPSAPGAVRAVGTGFAELHYELPRHPSK
jgi:hypothetical protein